MAETILTRPAGEQFKDDYTRYALYTTYKRVLSDFRDGLKPVQRRIIYAMFNDTKAIGHTVKSAAVTGDVMKLYHPHGDSGIYGTFKPMVNWWESKVPLLDKQGNFGNLSGDIESAARYTEVKLSKFAMECVIGELADTKKSVDWDDNYSNTCKEPEFLPVKVPLLLIEGSLGIGVGLRADIPAHRRP